MHWPPFSHGNTSHGKASSVVVLEGDDVVTVVDDVVDDGVVDTVVGQLDGQLHVKTLFSS